MGWGVRKKRKKREEIGALKSCAAIVNTRKEEPAGQGWRSTLHACRWSSGSREEGMGNAIVACYAMAMLCIKE
jgi:hypothetical protein